MSKNKVLVIVGAGPGIGMSIAKQFGMEGFSVALIARRLDKLFLYEKELRLAGIEAKGFPGDAASEVSLKTAIEAIVDTYGRIDVLHYNAAGKTSGSPIELRMADAVRDFKISVAGALVSVQECLPHMGNDGAVLLTGGGFAYAPLAQYTSLSLGKAGIRNLAQSLHQELAPRGIYVGTLTISGFVSPDTYYSPDRIAHSFYQMYCDRKETEIIFEEHSNSVH
ncbi:short-chain dehydrogenase [Fictibacillus macauensis ZFHKF-1]|uniref:Short-chain dehydrogenase n=1 Tax=Fictibacillus macauensis ZFHKF-1 TaxID=1196324 RepID=I8AEZ6_9BACL|nr:SDR family NAD(P)-dependent oxidoreductase [Fictibacillus macauensis]EIT83929.1 short-chain dehydrogenase [Fictibacillus macauensis ZFHKF-1]